MKEFFKAVPIPMAGVALGLTALGNLLRSISEELRLFCGVLGFIFALLVILKFIICPSTVKDEFENPIIASVSATIFMSVMQLCTYAYPMIGQSMFYVWCVAVTAHLYLMIHYTVKFLRKLNLKEVFPTCFITYVGIVVASVTSTTFHMEQLGKWIFWLGFVSYIVIFAIITIRYMKHEVEEPSKPLFCIYAAPMSLSLTGYLSVIENTSVVFMLILGVLAQILYIMVLFKLPKLLKLPFYPSYAAFTFPFVITAFGLQKLIEHLTSMHIGVPAVLNIVLGIESLIAVLLVGYTVIHYTRFLFIKYREIRLCEA